MQNISDSKKNKKGPKQRKKQDGVEGKDYYYYRLARTLTRPTLIRYLKKYCDEKDISPSDAIHILAMDKLKDIYGTPPNLLQTIMEASQRLNQQK